MNKIILISDNQIDTDLFNNQIFLEDTQRSETLASPVSPTETETKTERTNYSLFIMIASVCILLITLFVFLKRKTNKPQIEKTIVQTKNENITETEEIIEKQPLTRKRIKGQTYDVPTSLNEVIKQFLNMTKIK